MEKQKPFGFQRLKQFVGPWTVSLETLSNTQTINNNYLLLMTTITMQKTITKRLGMWAVVVALLLMLPFLAMQFDWQILDPGSSTRESVNWSVGDFVFAGVLLFGSALAYEFATRNVSNPKHKVVIGIVVATVLFIVWVGAATGFGFE